VRALRLDTGKPDAAYPASVIDHFPRADAKIAVARVEET